MKLWSDMIKPIVVLGVICAVTSALLAVTNGVTAPIIEQNTTKVADETRAALLPAATDGFVVLKTDADNVTAMYEAKNASGYVVTAQAAGYAGAVPVMVAFDTQGKMVAVNFLANSETPGLGQKIRSDKFQNQFSGKDAQPLSLSDIDAIAGATISSGAAVTAVNAAVAAYDEVAGIDRVDLTKLTEDEIHARVLPEHGVLTAVNTVSVDGITKLLQAENGGMIVYAQLPGFYKKPITAVVGFDASGVVTGVWFDAQAETAGVGDQVGTSESFAAQFVGQAKTAEVDAIAGATTSSNTAIEAVQRAMAGYEAGKGA